MIANDENRKECCKLAAKLITIPGFPREFPEAIPIMADDLMELCASIEQAEKLVAYARRNWSEWKGTAGLVFFAKYFSDAKEE